MYGVLEATQFPQKREIVKAKERNHNMEEKKEETAKEKVGRYRHMPGFLDLQQEAGNGVNMVQFLDEVLRKSTKPTRILL